MAHSARFEAEVRHRGTSRGGGGGFRQQLSSPFRTQRLRPHPRPPGHQPLPRFARFLFFRQAYTGHKNRIKLRIRFYDDEWKRPAFLEIKRRLNEVICKDRAMMTREGVRQILAEAGPARPIGPTTTIFIQANGGRM